MYSSSAVLKRGLSEEARIHQNLNRIFLQYVFRRNSIGHGVCSSGLIYEVQRCQETSVKQKGKQSALSVKGGCT